MNVHVLKQYTINSLSKLLQIFLKCNIQQTVIFNLMYEVRENVFSYLEILLFILM